MRHVPHRTYIQLHNYNPVKIQTCHQRSLIRFTELHSAFYRISAGISKRYVAALAPPQEKFFSWTVRSFSTNLTCFWTKLLLSRPVFEERTVRYV